MSGQTYVKIVLKKFLKIVLNVQVAALIPEFWVELSLFFFTLFFTLYRVTLF